jgi:hypothetical protein
MVNNVELKKKVDEKEHYSLWVVKIPDTPVDVYGIVNKEFDVLEMSTSVLCNARKMLAALDGWENGIPANEDSILPEILG